MSKKGFAEFEWEIRDSRDGDKTLLLGGRAVYSLYSPLKNADSTARSLIVQATKEERDYLIIIGLGFGYLQRSLYNLGYKNIIVWEPFPLMQKSFPVCGGEWKESVTIVYDYESFVKSVLHFARRGARTRLFIHPGYDIFCRLEHRLAVQLLKTIYRDSKGPEYIVSRRALDTLVRLPFLRTVKDFKGTFKGKKAILTSPGPSLKSCIPVLKNHDNSIIIASLQSAPLLQKNGIKVHFVTCADPNDMGLLLNDCSSDFGVFLAESSCDPSTLDWHREKTFLFHFRCGQLHELSWETAGLPVIEDPVCTVSEVMLLLADYMGFDEIYCLGMDLCWKDSPYSYRIKIKYDDLDLSGMMSKFTILDNDGQIAKTKPHYFHAARYLQQKCSELKTKGKLIYQMKGGIDLNASAVLTPDELQDKLKSNDGAVSFEIKNTVPPVTISQVENILKQTKNGSIPCKHNRTGEKDENSKYEQRPFLQEIPLEELPSVCDIFLKKLRSADMSAG